MDRRQALGGILALVLAAPGHAAEKVVRIGFIANTVSMEDLVAKRGPIAAARIIADGLRDLGWVEGRNLQFIYRTADRDFSRLPAIAREIVALRPDVIVAFGPGVVAAQEATRAIPIVMVTGTFVLEGGMAKSLARPGGNVTGMTLDVAATMNGKRLSLLIDRILRGAKPADTPIEQPRKFELYVNLSATRAIGLTMPPALLAQATRIIQ